MILVHFLIIFFKLGNVGNVDMNVEILILLFLKLYTSKLVILYILKLRPLLLNHAGSQTNPVMLFRIGKQWKDPERKINCSGWMLYLWGCANNDIYNLSCAKVFQLQPNFRLRIVHFDLDVNPQVLKLKLLVSSLLICRLRNAIRTYINTNLFV